MRFLTEFIFDTFDEGMKVHTEIFKLGNKQGYISYADLYFICNNMKKPKFIFPQIYNNHGWTNLSDVKLVSEANKCILKMPSVINIENKINMIKESKDKNERTINKNS